MLSENRQWFDKAEAFRREGDLPAALDAYRRALKINPGVAAPWVGLSMVLRANQQPEEELQCLIHANRAEPRNIAVSTRLANAYRGLGRMNEARIAYESALALCPNDIPAAFGFGLWHEDQGDAEGAAQYYRQVLASEPGHADALGAIVGLGQDVDVTQEILAAREAMAEGDDRAKAMIGYGLGRAFERLGDHKAAFDTLAEANRARRRQAGPFNRMAFDRRVGSMMEIFSANFFRERVGWGTSSTVPVFVVGLPRSGTTLTEQILGSHPDCFGAGELDHLTDLATSTPHRLSRADPPWPETAPELTANQVRAIGEDYLKRIAKLASGMPARIVDKQPLNFWHLGLVAMALPGSTIIHCTRDIRDNGLSIFAQNFNTDQRWATDLGDIAHYWIGYRRLMDHWKTVSGLKIIDVAYEDTVTDFEAQARRLLDVVNLGWDARVLAFHKNERAVQTPSRWQVRQPLYTTSSEKWRAYKARLGPLIEVAENG